MTTSYPPPESSRLLPRVAARSDARDRRARLAAILGAAAWAAIAVLARAGILRIGSIELMFLFAPLVVVPLGTELGNRIGGVGPLQGTEPYLQLLGAAAASVALCLPPGRWAGLLAAAWMFTCWLMAGTGAMAGVRALGVRLQDDPDQSRFVILALALARIDLAVGGTWLVASRLGIHPAGIEEPIGLLTAVHFHFAGFATATIAAATLRFALNTGLEKWLKPILPFVTGMPYVVAIGFLVSPALKMAAALLFSAGIAGLAVVLRASAKRVDQSAARWLLEIAAGAVFAGMILSGAYAILDWAGSDGLTIPQMARTHGILNAVGFSMTGLLGWLVEFSPPRDQTF
jgi:YndJ-like protein